MNSASNTMPHAKRGYSLSVVVLIILLYFFAGLLALGVWGYRSLRVFNGADTVFSTRPRDLGISYSVGEQTDIAQSPDSSRFAYRLVNTLYLVQPRQQLMRKL